MPVSWRWRLGVALVGLVLLSHSGAAAKIDRFKDKEGNLHITNVGEEPVKKGGVTTPTPSATPTPSPTPAPTAAPAPPPLPRPVPPLPPPPPPPEQAPPPPGEPVEPVEPPPVMEPELNEPPVAPPAPEAGNDEGQVRANPGAAVEQAEPAQPAVRRIPGRGGQGRGVLVR